MNLIKSPFFWSSAHRDTKFTFDFDTYVINGLFTELVDRGGFMTLVTSNTLIGVGEGSIIYVDSGIYKGYHVVTSAEVVDFFWEIVTETVYTADQLTGNFKYITSHVFEIYSGYSSGDLATLLPRTLIATFRPESNVDGYLVVNVSGYLKKLFDVINSNLTTEINGHDVYYNLFNAYEVIVDGGSLGVGMTLNASIDMYELNRDYIDTGRYLNGGSLGNHYLSCGVTDEIEIVGGYVQNVLTYTDGVDNAQPDFLVADFNPADFKTSI